MRQLKYFFVGKKVYQKLFSWLHKLSIEGLNYGGGSDFRYSGELYAANYIKSKIHGQELITIFDVGANIGRYSLELANVFTDKYLKVYSFEPSATTFEKLCKITVSNPNIFPNCIGFSDTKQKVLLFSNGDLHSGIASIYKRNLDHVNIFLNHTEEIILDTIDNYCYEKGIGKIHFLKLDIEGHELFAIKGAMEMIKRNEIKFIQFEFGGCNIDSRTYFQDFWYLLKDYYQFYRIVKDGLVPVNEYYETMEIFTTVNYLLELK